MKVGIVGTGLAGLTCARELYNRNIEVELFEKCNKNESTRPCQMEGAVHFLNNVPDIKPTREMRKAVFESKQQKVELKGKIGYLFEIGGSNGIEATLRREVEEYVPINYGKNIDKVDELKESFDLVVAADGYRSLLVKNLEIRESTYERMGFGIGCTVEGNFDIHESWTLFDDYYAPKGYTYMIPFSKNTASFVSASIVKTLDAKEIRKRLESLAKEKGYRIVDRWNDFETWYKFTSYHKDNVYVIGGAASLTEKSFGFGMKWAIYSARLCAEAISNNTDYNKLLQNKLFPEFKFWNTIRRFIDSSVKDEYNSFVKSFNNPIVKHYIERGKYVPSLFRIAGWLKRN